MKIKDLKIHSILYKVYKDDVRTIKIVALDLKGFTYIPYSGFAMVMPYNTLPEHTLETEFPLKAAPVTFCSTLKEANDTVYSYYQNELKVVQDRCAALHAKQENIISKIKGFECIDINE